MTRKLIVSSLLSLLAACAADIGNPDQPELEEAEQLNWNQVQWNQLQWNGFTASFEAVSVMTQVPLATESYDPNTGVEELKYTLHDELSRDFMKYLVSCALDPAQALWWKDPWTGVSYSFRGGSAYCPAWGEPGGVADDACRQTVSACLLARVNAFGVAVEHSQRGHYADMSPIELASSVPAGNKYLDGSNITPLTSKCFPGVTGAARECNWRASKTGSCTPGASVTVGLGAPPASSCADPAIGNSYGADTIMRACSGIAGCKMTDSNYLGQANNTCGTAYPSVTFTCPSSGFFTTMIGHHVASSTPMTPGWKPGVKGAKFEDEKNVFEFQEATFYGDIFDPKGLHEEVAAAGIHVDPDSGEVIGRNFPDPIEGSIYQSMFACWSPTWTEGMAYATWRVCGGPVEENCAAVPVGACGASNTPDPPAPEPPHATYLCGVDDDPIQLGDGDFQFCDDASGRVWEHGITVFLNNPCDVIPDPEICANTSGVFPPNW